MLTNVPWSLQHTTFDTEPSYSLEEEHSGYSPQRAEAEQPAFEFMERESDWELPQHARSSSAGMLHFARNVVVSISTRSERCLTWGRDETVMKCLRQKGGDDEMPKVNWRKGIGLLLSCAAKKSVFTDGFTPCRQGALCERARRGAACL